MKKVKKETKKAYTCGINWQHDLCADNANSIEIFGSIKALKRARQCWKECGIVELEITLKKWTARQDIFSKSLKIGDSNGK